MSGKRVLALYAAVLLGFAVVLCRLYFLAENHTYAARAEAQSTVRLSLPARRGSFYDHSGLLLTGLETRYLALCFPGENNYPRLYAFTDSAGQALLYRNRNRSAPFLLEVDRDLSGRGIRCFATARRCAEVPLCQHLIGYLDAEGRGIAGLEKALDSQLAGTKEHDTLVCAVTAQGRLRAGETPQLTRQDSSAVGVQLTISRPVQRAAEAVAADTMTSGCILVLDTATAAVRASVSVPGYDPDDLAASLDAPDSPFLNRALESYAVGSVFKPVLAAAALEQGILPEYECTGAVVVDGQIFRCAGGVPHGTVDMTAALEKSCNGYFIRLGQQLGAETLLQMSRQLGFGQEVPVAGALHADAGKLPSAGELAQSGQLANFSFGQGGLLASPVQIAAMMNTIASGGVYRTPFFVCGSVDETDGTPLETLAHPQSRRVMSAENAALLRKMLQQVVEEGTAQDAAGLEEAVLITLKKQLEILLPAHEDGTLHLDATAAKCSEYEKQLEDLRDQKQALFERYLLGQIELDTYKSEKAVYDAEILKVKNAYAAVTAQAKLKREEQARQSNRQEIVHSIAEADALTSELTDLLIEKVYVFPDNRIEIVYKVHDLFE